MAHGTRRLRHLLRAAGLVAAGAAFSLALTCSGPEGAIERPPSSQRSAAETAEELVESARRGMLPAPAFASPAALAATGEGVTIADVAERVVHSVVNISSTRVSEAPRVGPFFNDPFFERFFGPHGHPQIPQERRQQSLGSGVIIDEAGTILTNNHVVQGADEITVTLDDNTEVPAKVVGRDPKSDLAVLALQGDDLPPLQPLRFGDSNRLRLGDVVLAVGNPFGVGRTVTMGIVSATGRANVGITDYEDFIQTDAAINPGNSGGALVDLEGNLVGINTAILSRTGGYQGIGFAIPSNMAQTIMKSLIETGRVDRGWLGVAIQDINGDLGKALGLSGIRGVVVADVVPDSPAQQAGLQRGDVIVAVNGQKVDSTGRLRNVIATLGSGAKVQLQVLRDGSERTVTTTLGSLPSEAAEPAGVEAGALSGLRLEPLNDSNRRTYEVPARIREGVVVAEVKPGSQAQAVGFRPGDVILEVNRQPVRSARDVETAYERSRDRVLLLVYRQGSTSFLVVPKRDR